ncbi:MAG: glycosyltransferase family 39 protein, partial [Chloroflexi bacterium]|nr:glycosyltransferase family 39 protein [Chloroflexota bacterium]
MSRPRELLLGALLVGVAGALRLFRLDALPFSEAEAARALTAASLLSGQPPGVWTEPALHAVSALTAFLFGLTDNALRLAPAFSGTAAVALLWLYRPMLGAVPTLAAQALLALSPTMIASSRTLSAEALAQPLLLLLVWCGLRFAAIGAGWALSSAAVCAGLLLNLGPAGISCLLALSLAPAVAWTMGRGVRGVPPTRWVEGLVAFLIAFTLGASGLLLNPQGFGAPALRAWAAAFEPQPATGLLNLGALKLGVYETAVLFAGVPAAVWAFWRVRQAPAVLPLFAMWAAGGLLLLGAMGDRGAWTLLPAALPLTVLAGAGLGTTRRE